VENVFLLQLLSVCEIIVRKMRLVSEDYVRAHPVVASSPVLSWGPNACRIRR
jgi:hypothetical protein